MTADVENTNRGLAAVYTFAFHLLVLLFIFFFIFKTPIPPYPEFGGGSGLEVNFGNSDQGLGDNLSEQLIPIETKTISSDNNDNVITQDQEETTTISSKDKKVKTKNVIQINDPVVNKGALYSKKSKANQGIAGGVGNQGKENGDVNSSNYKGNGGSGGGPGKGNGTGIGDGNGPGTSYNLSGRKITVLPKPAYNSDEQGKVVVAITVDKTGKVITAVAGAKGTTITDKTLLRQSEQAALKAKFDAKSDAAIEQKGTITYVFIKLN
ncbi:MAG: energy transducer TonB [Bacteroidetes bacterium]|nr:energy transducer TonB [Bacteroidota bacterium]